MIASFEPFEALLGSTSADTNSSQDTSGSQLPTPTNSSYEGTSSFFRSFEDGVPLIEQVSESAGRPASAEFPHSYKIPGTEIWWKIGGFIKADVIHDFNPITSGGQFFPPDILTNGTHGQDTILQASATRLNLDFRAPTDWGVGRAFVETDFFDSDNELRLRHAYVENGSLLVGQTWTLWTDPEARPRTLDFESPVSFTLLRHAQVRWTQRVSDTFDWAVSIEDPVTNVDSTVSNTLPGQAEQPWPDVVGRIKYHDKKYEGVAAILLRDLVYVPDNEPPQNRLGWGVNLIGIDHLSDRDVLEGQFVFGSGLGSYRGGADLTLSSPTRVATIPIVGAYGGYTHFWTKQLSSTAVYSWGVRRETEIDATDTIRSTNYVAVNLIWEPFQRLTMGIEYLYGTRTDKDGAFGEDSRIQCTVQYNLP